LPSLFRLGNMSLWSARTTRHRQILGMGGTHSGKTHEHDQVNQQIDFFQKTLQRVRQTSLSTRIHPERAK